MNCFTKSIELEPSNYEAWLNRGIALTELGKHLEALADFDEVLKLKLSLGVVWFRKELAIERFAKMWSHWSIKTNSFEMQRNVSKEQTSWGLKIGSKGTLSGMPPRSSSRRCFGFHFGIQLFQVFRTMDCIEMGISPRSHNKQETPTLANMFSNKE